MQRKGSHEEDLSENKEMAGHPSEIPTNPQVGGSNPSGRALKITKKTGRDEEKHRLYNPPILHQFFMMDFRSDYAAE
jgi:hypothetical protein